MEAENNFTEEKKQFAVLIDSDNVSAKYAAVIFDELEKYGYASCRRIYGNWSKGSDWTERKLLDYSIMPIQQFDYTTGKNATDMAMVIDAMDLLYKDKVDGFCLVTSDSDFTRLAMRLREEQKYVLGMGESKTPQALKKACNKFVLLNLVGSSDKEMSTGNADLTIQGVDMDNVTSIEDVERAIEAMFVELGTSRLDLAYVGSRLNEKFTDFDARNYGYSKLSVFLLEEMTHFKVTKINNHHCLVKEEQLSKTKLHEEIVAIIMKNGGSLDNLSIIHDELTKKYRNFNVNDYGYKAMSKLLRSMDDLIVNANTVKIKKN